MVVLPASTWARMPRLRTVGRPAERLARTVQETSRSDQGQDGAIPVANQLLQTRTEAWHACLAGQGGGTDQGLVTSFGDGRAADAGQPELPGSPQTATGGRRQRRDDARPAPLTYRGALR